MFITTLTCAALFVSTATAATASVPLHGGRSKGVFDQIQGKFRSVPVAIRNLKISTPHDKVELVDMANEFTNRIQSITYSLNQATCNMKNQDYKRKMEDILLSSTDIVHEVQRCMYGDSAKLQKQLATAFESFAGLTDKSMQVLKTHFGDGEPFINNQLREASDMTIWTINKVYYQAIYFTKTNKELNKEIDTVLVPLGKAFDKIKTNDEETKDEVVHLVRLSEQLTHSIVLKLEHWMAINSKDEPSYKIIKEAADVMSKLYDQHHALAEANLSATETIKKYKEMYGSGSVKIKKLTDAILQENLGGQEYVRSVILDCITLAGTFSAELELFVAKKNTHAFR